MVTKISFEQNENSNLKSYEVPFTTVSAKIFPFLTVICTCLAFFGGYAVGVGNDHEDPWLPFISDGGATVPESCIFGLFLAHAGFFWFITSMCLHIQLTHFIKYTISAKSKLLYVVNFLFVLAIIVAVGNVVVATFQEGAVALVHQFGALFSFYGGLIYMWVFVILSFKMKNTFSPKKLTIFRMCVAIFQTVAIAFYQFCQLSPTKPFVIANEDGTFPTKPPGNGWGVVRLVPGDAYYMNHFIAALGEWSAGLGNMFVIITFAYELSSFKIFTYSKNTSSYNLPTHNVHSTNNGESHVFDEKM